LSSAIDTKLAVCYLRFAMAPKALPDDSAAVHIRGIPRETFFRLKMAAASEKKTVRALLLKLIEDKIQDLERKGLLPKGKGTAK
jgi:hypothetical protein